MLPAVFNFEGFRSLKRITDIQGIKASQETAMKQYFKLLPNILIFLALTTSLARASELPDRARTLFQSHEQECIKNGWKKMYVNVAGDKRKVLFKLPESKIKGAIILLHGGGGSYSNYCANLWYGKPMVKFSSLALKEGFAIFSPDSGWNSFSDKNGNLCGKRWASLDQGDHSQKDLDFIKTIITKIIPSKLPASASRNAFMSGISNGGYMTILSLTRLSKHIKAIAPVSAGNPYSTRMDCKRRERDRLIAPGRYFHNSGHMISENNACSSNHIKLLPKATKSKTQDVPFKQFHHKDDSLVDLSCMKEAQRFLIKNGFKDDAPHIASHFGGKRLWKHFWLKQYNAPIISFFKAQLR